MEHRTYGPTAGPGPTPGAAIRRWIKLDWNQKPLTAALYLVQTLFQFDIGSRNFYAADTLPTECAARGVSSCISTGRVTASARSPMLLVLAMSRYVAARDGDYECRFISAAMRKDRQYSQLVGTIWRAAWSARRVVAGQNP